MTIKNIQTTMKVSDEKWERIFGKKNKQTEDENRIDLLLRISQVPYYQKLHPELSIQEICKLYDIDEQTYYEATNNE